jgi:Rrf2 family nitric oxide-sensitive transcriptional repressor
VRVVVSPESLRLTAYTDFSLRVLMYLGLNPARAPTVKEIAESFGVSRNHLMKVVHRLSMFGYVDALRGRGGGLRLARQPEDIRVGAVVRDTEDDLAAVRCLRPGPSQCCIQPACVLRDALRAATGAFLDVLDHYTLADLLKPADRLGSLLADHGRGDDKPTA